MAIVGSQTLSPALGGALAAAAAAPAPPGGVVPAAGAADEAAAEGAALAMTSYLAALEIYNVLEHGIRHRNEARSGLKTALGRDQFSKLIRQVDVRHFERM